MSPKGYISYSQLDLFEQSEKQYIDKYFYNIKPPSTPAMELGSRVSEYLQTHNEDIVIYDDYHLDNAAKDILIRVPKYEVMEKKIEVSKDGIAMFGYLDTAMDDLSAFREYKTGTTQYTYKSVLKHDQVTFYAMMIYFITGEIPKKISLIKIPISYKGILGPVHEEFITHRSLEDVLKMYSRVVAMDKRMTDLMLGL